MTDEESWLKLVRGFGLKPNLKKYDESKAYEYYGVNVGINTWSLEEGDDLVQGYGGFFQNWGFESKTGKFVFTGSWE